MLKKPEIPKISTSYENHDLENSFPKEIKPYMKEIAERLWSGHASVMIGAGFSKNAIKGDSNSKDFVDWNELGDIFYRTVNGTSTNGNMYLNVLRLADQVQAAFGRSKLENILQEEIPDLEYAPSELHEKLLQLPWSDVFTTNYDTLLERATDKEVNIRYDIVKNKEDLIYSTKPRIIKLHGSFQSHRPFIITEEDYRKYPVEFAPFVNTVQQSMLENTFCLLGFSGDDPNFLNWVGWIRDNLGSENSPKIYLIGLLSLSHAQEKLLIQRNIIPINLTYCENVNGDHKKALLQFIEFLSKGKKNIINLNWPNENVWISYNRSLERNKQIIDLISYYNKQRREYPNWIVCPETTRNMLLNYTSHILHFLTDLNEINLPNDIDLLYEHNWRLEKCLLPIENDLAAIYETIIKKYNPFPNQIESLNCVDPITHDNINWKEITNKWIELQFGLLRFYREEFKHKQWLNLSDKLNLLYSNLSEKSVARLHYEKCMYYLFNLDISELYEELNKWPNNNSLSFWEAKKAGLYAELGQFPKAIQILERSLSNIRSHLNLNPNIVDYNYVSQEAYVMLLLNYIKSSFAYIERDYKERELMISQYKERWNLFAQYKCDPEEELKLFNAKLNSVKAFHVKNVKEYQFNIGQYSRGVNTSIDSKIINVAYSFLRFTEEIGLPYKLPYLIIIEKSLKPTIELLINYSSYWAISACIRNGDDKIIELAFDRKSLSKYNNEEINDQTLKYVFILYNIVGDVRKDGNNRKESLGSKLAIVIPNILSKLCLKADYETKLSIVNLLQEIYQSDNKNMYKEIRQLVKNLITSFDDNQQIELISTLLTFPILHEIDEKLDLEYPDPIEFVRLEIKRKITKKYNAINLNIIKEYEKFADETKIARRRVLKRLTTLYEIGLLYDKQANIFGYILWKEIDVESGFPNLEDYYKFSFIKLPHPNSINPLEKYYVYINSGSFPKNTSKNKGYTVTDGRHLFSEDITYASKTGIFIKWRKDDLKKLIQKIINWWDSDKGILKEEESHHFWGSRRSEYSKRFSNLATIYSCIIAENLNIIEEIDMKEIIRIAKEFEEYGILYNEIQSSLFPKINEIEKINLRRHIKVNLLSKQEDKINDALKAVIRLLKFEDNKIFEIVVLISEQIRSRSESNIEYFLIRMRNIVLKYPELLNKKILENLEIGLNNLIGETKLIFTDLSSVANHRNTIRFYCSELANSLYCYYLKNDIDIPEYINQWKQICTDENEFAEIRNVWLNAEEEI